MSSSSRSDITPSRHISNEVRSRELYSVSLLLLGVRFDLRSLLQTDAFRVPFRQQVGRADNPDSRGNFASVVKTVGRSLRIVSKELVRRSKGTHEEQNTVDVPKHVEFYTAQDACLP